MLIDINRSNGITFSIPPNQSKVPVHALKKGDIVTFSCDTYSRHSVPVNPIIFQIRSDMNWRDVLKENRERKHQSGMNCEG